MKPELLIVDDDQDIRSQLRWALSGEYKVCLAQDRSTALAAFKEIRPKVVLLDLGLPPHPGTPDEGMVTLAELTALDRFVKVIVLTGQSEKENATRAVGGGAYDFFCKPAEIEELKILLKRAFQVSVLEREYYDLKQHSSTAAFGDMLGTSPQIQTVFHSLQRVARTDASVVVLGESGTGKEMAARAIHRLSRRKDHPFIAINCGAIPETLIESELFGYEKGAFTGAVTAREGRFEMAQGGTLLLDEIGELPLSLQVKLLRFLQDQIIERVGGRTRIKIDARVVAATNVDLQKAVREGQFREDLYYRLAVVTITVPPLRERVGDSRLLAESLLMDLGRENRRTSVRFAPEALLAMEGYSWPGNVRELENRVRRAFIMSAGGQITAEDLELPVADPNLPTATLKEARADVEKHLIEQALRRNKGKIAGAASALGISRPTLYELMEKLGISRPSGLRKTESESASLTMPLMRREERP